MMDELNLFDIWHDAHKETKRYTWRRKVGFNVIQQGRLDYFLVSDLLTSFCKKEAINPGYRTDHSIISFSINLLNTVKGRTLWKFNNSLLKKGIYKNS